MNLDRHLILARKSTGPLSELATGLSEFTGYPFESAENWLISPENFKPYELLRTRFISEGFAGVLAFGFGMASALPALTQGIVMVLGPPIKDIQIPRAMTIVCPTENIAKKTRASFPYNRVKVCRPGVLDRTLVKINEIPSEIILEVVGAIPTLEFIEKLTAASLKRGISLKIVYGSNLVRSDVLIELKSGPDYPLELLPRLVNGTPLLCTETTSQLLGLKHLQDCLVISEGEDCINSIVGALQLPMKLESTGLAARATILSTHDATKQFSELLNLYLQSLNR